MNSTILLHDLIKQATLSLEEKRYSPGAIAHCQATWRLLESECLKKGSPLHDPGLCLSIVKKHYKIPKLGKASPNQTSRLRHLKMLEEISAGNSIGRCSKSKAALEPGNFVPVLDPYEAYTLGKGLSQKTAQGKRTTIARFMNYLQSMGVTDLAMSAPSCVLGFMEELSSSKLSSQTRSLSLFTLRDFLVFCERESIAEEKCSGLLGTIQTKKNERVPSLYPVADRRKLLSLVDRSTAGGKREYAILLLAIQLGIRAGDIRHLKTSDIHWSRGTLEFTQQKTGNPIALPLPENVKFALLDYLKNARPETGADAVFIRSRAPFEPYGGNNSFLYIVEKYMGKAGVDYSNRKHGLHSVRHSLAATLLKGNTPYTVISGILGHEDTSTTTQACLPIDIAQLKEAALGVQNGE